MKQKLDKFLVGLIIGLTAPFLLFVIYHLVRHGHMGIHNFVNYIRLEGTFSPRISLCVILNLGIFFTFYWLKMDRAAKGVIGATFLYAFLVVYLKMIY